MLGRTSGDGSFRYLHDEISGGELSWSHLKTRSAYSGDCFGVSVDDYGFDSDKFADLSAAAIDYPSTAGAVYYDQVNNYDITGRSSAWDGSIPDFLVDLGCTSIGLSTGYNTTKAWTVIVVFNKSATDSGTIQTIFNLFNIGLDFRCYYNGTNLLRVGWLSPGAYLKDHSGQRNTGTKMLCVTYDGSENVSGLNLYINDMSSSVDGSTFGSPPTWNSTQYNRLSLAQNVNGSGQVLGNSINTEMHFFDSVLDSSDRNTAKEILEQYYTFT